jgi:hypothetical protein
MSNTNHQKLDYYSIDLFNVNCQMTQIQVEKWKPSNKEIVLYIKHSI